MHNDNKTKYLINFLSLSGSQIISNLLTFITFSLIARYLGVEQFGIFNYYLAFTFIIVKIIDLGFAPIVFRELSIEKQNYTVFNTALNFRLLLFFIIFLISNIIIIINIKLSIKEIMIFNFLMFSALISYKSVIIRELLDIPFKVNYSIYISSLLVLLENILLLSSVFIIKKFNWGVTEFAFAYFFVNVPSIIALFVIIKRKFTYKYKLEFNNLKWLIISSLPIFVCIISDTILMQIDVVMMKYFNTNYDLGIYSAVIRLVFPFLFIATAFVHNVFPKLSEKKNNNDILASFSIRSLYIIATFIAAILFFKSKEIILIVFGKNYLQGHTALEILSISLIPLFYNYFYINYLIAENSQSKMNYYSIIQLFVNLILNFFLLKYLSYNGAAISRLVTILIGAAILSIIAYKMNFKIDYRITNILLFTMIIFSSLWFIQNLNIIVFFILTVIIFTVSVYISKIYQKEEINLLLSLLKIRTK